MDESYNNNGDGTTRDARNERVLAPFLRDFGDCTNLHREAGALAGAAFQAGLAQKLCRKPILKARSPEPASALLPTV